MNKKSLTAVAVVLACLTSECIMAAPPPSFEVATIKPADPDEAGPGDIARNMSDSPGHFAMRNVSLRFCLEWAYDLKDYEISGPDWIKSEIRYDIAANPPGPASDNEMRLMLQTLLTERFQMKFHRETKNVDVYALTLGKGPLKFKEAKSDEQTSLSGTPTGAMFTKQPISRLTFLLTRRMDRPAIDLTGLKGVYDFTLDLSGLGFNGNPPQDTSAPSIFTTVQENLGLKLEARKAPIEILVIDHAEKTPTAN